MMYRTFIWNFGNLRSGLRDFFYFISWLKVLPYFWKFLLYHSLHDIYHKLKTEVVDPENEYTQRWQRHAAV